MLIGALRQKLLFLEVYAYEASSWVGNLTITSLIGSESEAPVLSVLHEETHQLFCVNVIQACSIKKFTTFTGNR